MWRSQPLPETIRRIKSRSRKDETCELLTVVWDGLREGDRIDRLSSDDPRLGSSAQASPSIRQLCWIVKAIHDIPPIFRFGRRGLGCVGLSVDDDIFEREVGDAEGVELVILDGDVEILQEDVGDVGLARIGLDGAEGRVRALDADEV